MSWFNFSNPPTTTQIDYAEGLIARLLALGSTQAISFAKRVAECESRTVMSELLTEMEEERDRLRD